MLCLLLNFLFSQIQLKKEKLILLCASIQINHFSLKEFKNYLHLFLLSLNIEQDSMI